MQQQRGKAAAGTGDVDHAVAEVLLFPVLTCHPFDAFRVPAFRMLLAASSPLLSCSSCGFDCVLEVVSYCDAFWLLLLLPVTLLSVSREEEVLWKKRMKERFFS
ncbi:unnamed protein product [Sphagnum troendelagicum]|uniref:Uncharacterized protein n=1 Tax=Sphagnum troendelagicum TaxID=128251 RepID=A0ABP0U1N9_9BRYO